MYWPDLGKVQKIGDMNIVSQMCAIAVMFVIMYFYISQKKIILHTSKAFVEVWIAGLLSLFFDIFALVAIEKRSGYPHTATAKSAMRLTVPSYCYQYYLQIISLDGHMGCHGGLLVYMRGYFQEKRA